jgi:hypothetical protein
MVLVCIVQWLPIRQEGMPNQDSYAGIVGYKSNLKDEIYQVVIQIK